MSAAATIEEAAKKLHERVDKFAADQRRQERERPDDFKDIIVDDVIIWFSEFGLD